MRRATCSGCSNGDLKPFLDLGSSPIADAYTSRPDEESPTYPLEVAVCDECRLVQLLEALPHEVLFGTGYSFYTSASAPLSQYHERYVSSVLDRFDVRGQFVVEVGSNDGDLLRHFLPISASVLGIDPAAGPAAAAAERGLETVVQPFSTDLADSILSDRGPARLIIANHVLAHVADVADVLAGMSLLLASDGHAVVEVQYLPDLLINNAFDLVYHEHRNFFSLTTLERAALRHGLHVVDAHLTDRQGGSLRVVLSKKSAPIDVVGGLRESETWLETFSAYDGMQGRAERIRARLLGLIDDERALGSRVVGYGAPAKATTLLNFCGLGREHIVFVTDTTPAKQGRYIPGVGIEIRAPESIDRNEVDTFLLLAWNYLPQIVRQQGFTGRWIVPIPVPIRF